MIRDKDGVSGASPVATGLAGAEAPEPHSRLGPSDGIPSAADYDDMHHAFGRPRSADVDCYRNYYCVGVETSTAKRFEALGWWDFGHTINGGRDGIFHVNGAGKQALAEWMGAHRYEHGRWIASAIEARQRPDPAEGLDPKGESAGAESETPKGGQP